LEQKMGSGDQKVQFQEKASSEGLFFFFLVSNVANQLTAIPKHPFFILSQPFFPQNNSTFP